MALTLALRIALNGLSDLHTQWTECLVVQACIRAWEMALTLALGMALAGLSDLHTL